MKLSSEQDQEPELNLTPMIDVVFLLLLFFMVSTSFVRESTLEVNLPEATAKPNNEIENLKVDIIITKQGNIKINDKVLNEFDNVAFNEILQQIAEPKHNPQLIISADANADYQDVITVMDAAQQLGYRRLTLATRHKSGTP